MRQKENVISPPSKPLKKHERKLNPSDIKLPAGLLIIAWLANR